jgi:ankyrin repeat protein
MEAAAALIGLGGADLSVRDNAGATPLHVAVDKNHLMLAKTLMDRGAAVDTTTHVSAARTLRLKLTHAWLSRLSVSWPLCRARV